jgi:hypothetical protein
MSSPPHSQESQGSDLPQATTLSSENATTDRDSNPKFLLRRLRRQVLGKKFTKDKIQRAIQLYDLEKSYDSQSPEAMAKLERLFGINNIEWPSEEDRLMGIADKVENSLKKILFSQGCVLFLYILSSPYPQTC